MTTDATALAKLDEWTGICGDAPEFLVEELAALGFVVARREDVEHHRQELRERRRRGEGHLATAWWRPCPSPVRRLNLTGPRHRCRGPI
ncbi:hypothetical protein [Methylobacterium gnaphalii]|uniref:Uncharacterized protein n=1 Tax=Methylobacterium gnaphalii TaxID=1010610 RepID=A0A512JG40_9HYPH|nr:hypothetical protein [Methylobacterium gnaphalii]GEP08908.1 hypothetical protein MGN01_07530 [Methylobacterium gnaphalii]GJD70674.1 hypothetical protein MMMDOFMJ_3626 [Methylobacterium gnaphalii]GLS50446.1 hypothetical protein GCM10007885_32980 [Methylobacterium gnaphalii]